jgi:outer membrane beta-barrel protein
MMRSDRKPACRRAWRALLLILLVAVPWGAGSAFAQPTPGPADSVALEIPPAPPVPDSAVAEAPAAAPSPYNQALPIRRMVRLDESADNVVRSGPGDRFAIVGVFSKGTVFPVIAKSADWYNVRLSDTETGWIHSSLCEEFDDLSDLEFKPNPKLYSRTGSFVLSAYGGAYAFDRKSNSLVLGGRLGYYVLDWLQAEGGVAWTHVRRPAEIVESLFGLSLEAEEFHMLSYHLDLTFELLPGRQMVPYVTGGVGSSIMQGRSEPSFNYGAGTLVYISKRMATRWEVRSYRFDSGSDNSRVTNDNIEFSLGTSLLF